MFTIVEITFRRQAAVGALAAAAALITSVSLVAGPILSPRPSPQDEQLNARYVYQHKTVSDHGGQVYEYENRTTYRLKGQRQRVEQAGQPSYTLVQCDLERMVFVDPDRGYCCSQPLRGPGAAAATATATVLDLGDGGNVQISARYRDTGENRSVAGVRARGVEFRRSFEADSSSCGYRPGSIATSGEVWIAEDAPATLRPFRCPSQEEWSLEQAMRTNREDCRDDVTRDIEGDPSLLNGFPVAARIEILRNGGKTISETSLLELAYEPQDAALFDAPTDCTCGWQVTKEDDALEVTETDEELRILLSADVLFDFDSADLREEARDALHRVAKLLEEHAGAAITVEGHTDAVGSASYNQRLSERRAESVRRWLVEVAAIHEGLISTRGFGESRPVAPNSKPDGSDDPQGRQKNRRVEITIRK